MPKRDLSYKKGSWCLKICFSILNHWRQNQTNSPQWLLDESSKITSNQEKQTGSAEGSKESPPEQTERLGQWKWPSLPSKAPQRGAHKGFHPTVENWSTRVFTHWQTKMRTKHRTKGRGIIHGVLMMARSSAGKRSNNYNRVEYVPRTSRSVKGKATKRWKQECTWKAEGITNAKKRRDTQEKWQ